MHLQNENQYKEMHNSFRFLKNDLILETKIVNSILQITKYMIFIINKHSHLKKTVQFRNEAISRKQKTSRHSNFYGKSVEIF